MLLMFKVDGPEDLETLRHFAGCRTHQAITLDELVGSVERFLEAFDRGIIAEADEVFVGIEIEADALEGDDEGRGQDDANQPPPTVLEELLEAIGQAIHDANQEVKDRQAKRGPIGPPTDIRTN